MLVVVSPVHGQDLPRVSRYDVGNYYREARMQMQFNEILSTINTRVALRPPEHVPSPSDTVAAWIASRSQLKRVISRAICFIWSLIITVLS